MLSWRMDLSPLPICKVLLVAALFASLAMRPASASTLTIWAQLGPNNEQHREPNLVIRAITDGDGIGADDAHHTLRRRAKPQFGRASTARCSSAVQLHCS
jgi:hypothetical protein